MSRQQAELQHLFRRAGFGISPAEWTRRRSWTREEAVDALFAEARSTPPFGGYEEDEAGVLAMQEQQGQLTKAELRKQRKTFRKEQRRLLLTGINADWVRRMANPAQVGFQEKMMLFWHGHFAVQTLLANLARTYANRLHDHALGSLSDLVLAMATDPAMILFLNNQQNHKDHPNENFARELMELFTLGRGQYSEEDVREAARAFTGWSCVPRRAEFQYRPAAHDDGDKTVFGQTGNWNGQDILQMILARPETARFISRKIYRFFVNERVDEARVAALADRYYQTGYDTGDLMWHIFLSDWFYAPEHRGNRIKSPVELIAGLLKTFHADFQDPLALALGQAALGQVLFFPPNVAGWPGGTSWIDNQRLLLRLQLPMILFTAAEVDIRLPGNPQGDEERQQWRRLRADLDPVPLLTMVQGRTWSEAKEELAHFLLPQRPKNLGWLEPFLTGTEDGSDMLAWALRLCSLPEYQLG